MSYSFTVKAADKAGAKAAVAAKFVEVVAAQVCHQRDRAQALAVADAFIELLPDDADKDVGVSMAGSLTGAWQGTDVTRIHSANVSVTAYLADRTA